MRLTKLIADLQAFHAKHGEMEVLSLWEQHTTDIHGVFRGAPGHDDLAADAEDASPLQLLLLDVEGYPNDRDGYEHPDDRAPK